MELIKLNLEIPYEKAGAEKPESAAQLVCYLQQPQNMPVPRPAVVICPGGGYRYTSSRESESIAMQYLAAGMQAFVLYYNCAPAVFPCALLELAKSVSIVRSHAAEWNIDPEKILVAGFSAGGHLAASFRMLLESKLCLRTTRSFSRRHSSKWKYPLLSSHHIRRVRPQRLLQRAVQRT